MDPNILNKLDALKNEYYRNNAKTHFFKNAQKNECASAVANQIDLQTLFHNTIYILPNSNHLFFDYTVFKNYVNVHNMTEIVQYTMSIFNHLITQYNTFIFHVNMDTYSITSHERFKQIYPMFFDACSMANIDFNKHISVMHIYNPPKVLTTLSAFFSSFSGNQQIQDVNIYNKVESKYLLEKLIHNTTI